MRSRCDLYTMKAAFALTVLVTLLVPATAMQHTSGSVALASSTRASAGTVAVAALVDSLRAAPAALLASPQMAALQASFKEAPFRTSVIMGGLTILPMEGLNAVQELVSSCTDQDLKTVFDGGNGAQADEDPDAGHGAMEASMLFAFELLAIASHF